MSQHVAVAAELDGRTVAAAADLDWTAAAVETTAGWTRAAVAMANVDRTGAVVVPTVVVSTLQILKTRWIFLVLISLTVLVPVWLDGDGRQFM